MRSSCYDLLWKKQNFQDVMLICDKALSSSYMEELITFALLINLQAIHNDCEQKNSSFFLYPIPIWV